MRHTVSNCQFVAWPEFTRRYRLWRAAGYPRHCKPWIRLQPSDSEPHAVLHAQVGGMGEPALEFVPLERKNVPWWLVWTRILFRGRIRPVDFPVTLPEGPQ